MPDLFNLVYKWWKHILAIVTLSLVVVSIILYLKPSKYLSTATALPASTYSTDKASIFGNGLQQLYPAMGTPDDLDMIIGTAQLDTVYLAIAAAFDLAAHYRVNEKGAAALQKAAWQLKENTRVIKSDYSELKVKVWDNDKDMAPQLANAIVDKLQAIHQDIQNARNISLLNSLRLGRSRIQLSIDSLSMLSLTASSAIITDRKNTFTSHLQEYDKLVSQYELVVENKAPVLVVVDKARIPAWKDTPKPLPILAATLFLSLFFALLVVVILEKRNSFHQ